MDANALLGRALRAGREKLNLSLQELAARSGTSYQHISGIENGKENPTVESLAKLTSALGMSLTQLFLEAHYGATSDDPPPPVEPGWFRPAVPFPPGLSVDELAAALAETQGMIHLMNASLRAFGGKPLSSYVQRNNFSGVVSNVLCHALANHTRYDLNDEKAYPDLLDPQHPASGSRGLEVKSTINVAKGGESHNGHSGWHLVACFAVAADTGAIRFLHVMVAELVGHAEPNADWTYQGSRVKAATGSRRTETYVTNSHGLTKLRDGSVFLAPDLIFKKWKQARPAGTPTPTHSIFYQPDVPVSALAPKRPNKPKPPADKK